MFTRVIGDVFLLLGGLLMSKVYTYHLFPLLDHEPANVFPVAVLSAVAANVLVWQSMGLGEAMPCLNCGYVLGLVLVGGMLKSERKEYRRTGGHPEVFQDYPRKKKRGQRIDVVLNSAALLVAVVDVNWLITSLGSHGVNVFGLRVSAWIAALVASLIVARVLPPLGSEYRHHWSYLLTIIIYGGWRLLC